MASNTAAAKATPETGFSSKQGLSDLLQLHLSCAMVRCARAAPPCLSVPMDLSTSIPILAQYTKWTQTLAGLEVLHSLLGVVRAPLMTTLMQVASRFLLVWAIVDVFPFLALSPFYSSMLIAWSVTEIIRYSFFALSLSGYQPKFLTWLRYNTFFVLYPIGIFSECTLIWFATEPAGHINELYKWALYAILAIYVPGSYVLYTYMMSQRRKVMRNLKAQGQKAQ
ncbi:3-hydroxy acyl-CoA dehydratase [Fusarium oxysporum f. sp. lycopersici 4287]|uniref:Very-long-chain (3R)-3-hydroxyacyl-CoA dehydratase n=2 Tax=Fusarium oxysporum TaxID=5507 RepID=A0A0J9UE65_FUSO4|nr:3-hydroxy acyl-CoA dehydratase [Fusarium oxysporum f. sp. lycopersici 4287]KNA97389.1 3-hydroxy acyl-CoA dehydratase [Fusarium oxysporum f. sp. lycopersici 4287]